MEPYSGIDLHSSNNRVGIIDENYKRIFKKKLPNEPGVILDVLKPYSLRQIPDIVPCNERALIYLLKLITLKLHKNQVLII